MGTGQTIRKSSQWLLTGGVGINALQFFIGIALARLLVPEDFGLIVTVQVFTGIAGLIASGGLGQALVRSKHADQADFQTVFTVQLLVGILIYFIFFSIAPFIAAWFDTPLYIDLIRVSALSFILRPFTNIHNSFLHREMRFRERMIISLVSASITGATSIALALTGFGVWSLVFGGFSGSIYTAIHLAKITRLPIRLKFNFNRLQRISSYGIKVVANDLVEYIHHQISNLIISRIAGASMVGLFNKANSLGLLPQHTIGNAVYQPVFREMAKAQSNLDLSRYLFAKMTTLLTVYTLPIYIGMAWVAEPFIVFVYGVKWMEAAEPLQIIAIGGLLSCIIHPSGAVLAAHNRLGRELVVHGTSTVITSVGCIIGWNWGLTGVALGVVTGRLYTAAFMFFLVKSTIKTKWTDLTGYIAPGLYLNSLLIASLVLTDIILPSNFHVTNPGLYTIICALSGGLVYCLAFLFTPPQSVSPESKRWREKLNFP